MQGLSVGKGEFELGQSIMVGHYYLESCEPHQPVQAVVVWRDKAWPPPEVSWLTLELIVLPHCVGSTGIRAGCALQDHLSPFLGDTGGDEEGQRDHSIYLPPAGEGDAMSPCLPKVSQDGQEDRAQCPSQDAGPYLPKAP